MYNAILDEFEDDATRTRVSDRPFDESVVASEEPAREDDDTDDPTSEKGPKDGSSDDEMMPGIDDNESWSDDPVRMYLTQMGEIPLLTRQEEITLAKRIEDTDRKSVV